MSHRWFSSEHFDEGLACLEPLQEFWQQRRELGSQFRFLEIADSEPEHRRCRLTQTRPLGEVFVFRHEHLTGIERDLPNCRIARIRMQKIENVGGFLPAISQRNRERRRELRVDQEAHGRHLTRSVVRCGRLAGLRRAAPREDLRPPNRGTR